MRSPAKIRAPLPLLWPTVLLLPVDPVLVLVGFAGVLLIVIAGCMAAAISDPRFAPSPNICRSAEVEYRTGCVPRMEQVATVGGEGR
ncbi:hypothetical protein [Nocardia sp. NPDC051570]|uniref:hypothetical protein n=1 Tax=Nocardia sp. NPDC051570 TaxID=3364324 RepID=UPI0037AA3CE6